MVAVLGALALSVSLAACAAVPTVVEKLTTATSTAGLTDADGYIPNGDSLTLTSDKPAVTKLDPELLAALRAADRAAEDERGIPITITDGWRSERYQNVLFERAVQNYGSEEEASKWAKRGTDSAHVSGHAVDIATADAMDFLNRFGNRWGVCQVYANEIWHFELLTSPGGTCPPMAADGRG
ncbi:D-alanyl-D-alanine carboxypeptidase family protein [Leifsonia sp. Leaf336]|uniref:D-alanyl-D-alanine carboxypeptidase family protein n=1 Tax=Leifsonia sp. Leaf336 TaxID=1736341 RepID=UPI000ADBC6A5|nr:D-alanyl-D-alanine carboxypeptidase family protein [Leifsonia sp. Leaf336]